MAILSSTAFQLPRVLLDPVDSSDDNDLTTEILPAPPPLATVQQPPARKDSHARKHPVVLSYLPTSDPGSSYTGATGSLLGMEDDTRRRKRARLDKGYVALHADRSLLK